MRYRENLCVRRTFLAFFYTSNYATLIIYDAALRRTNTKLQSKERKASRWVILADDQTPRSFMQ